MPIPSGLDEDLLYEQGFKQSPSDRWWIPDYAYGMGVQRTVEPPDFEDRIEVEPGPDRFETDPQEFLMQLISHGQRYRGLPFGERFGDWPVDERQEGIRRLIEEIERQSARKSERA